MSGAPVKTATIISRYFPHNVIPLPPKQATTIKFKLTREIGHGLNTHQSNRARLGLYHGKDVKFGNKISFSHSKHRVKRSPNVQQKRVFSEALDGHVKFNMTTTAMKKIDDFGGIDNYILALDQSEVEGSNYIQKMRNKIASTKYYNGTLHEAISKRLGYLNEAPKTVAELDAIEAAIKLSRVAPTRKETIKLRKASFNAKLEKLRALSK